MLHWLSPGIENGNLFGSRSCGRVGFLKLLMASERSATHIAGPIPLRIMIHRRVSTVTHIGWRALFFLLASCALASTVTLAAILDPNTLTKYIDPLPILNVITPSGALDEDDLYDMSITQFSQQLHSQLSPTTLWGYNQTYPGPTFEVSRNEKIHIRWTNNLRDSNNDSLRHLLPYDTTVHGAGTQFPEARVVTHLHGGVTEAKSDGYPEDWFSPDPSAQANGMGGPAGNVGMTTHHNRQRATQLWYHDHAMGITRLNMYAGLAGTYFVRDDHETSLNLPSGGYEIPLIFQDRSFYDTGDLFYPRGPGDLVHPGTGDPLEGLPSDFPSDASLVPTYFGNTNLVNGMIWPHLEVEPRKYRFRMLNAAGSRFYDFKLETAGGDLVPFQQIGTDGGLFEYPVDRDTLLVSPAQRADVVVDFSDF